jgi:hypothetical protein
MGQGMEDLCSSGFRFFRPASRAPTICGDECSRDGGRQLFLEEPLVDPLVGTVADCGEDLFLAGICGEDQDRNVASTVAQRSHHRTAIEPSTVPIRNEEIVPFGGRYHDLPANDLAGWVVTGPSKNVFQPCDFAAGTAGDQYAHG